MNLVLSPRCVLYMYIAVQMDQPETVFALRGETPTFHCQGNGSILWHINNTLYDFRNAEHFARKGVLLEASYIEDRTSSLQGITFRTSASDNNNTQFSCTVFGPGSEIHTSNRSTLIVIGELCMHFMFYCTG